MGRFSRVMVVGMVAALAGCTPDIYAEVESDTQWSGSFGARTVDGSGRQRIDLPDDPPQCVVVQKETEAGFLRVRVESEGGGWLIAGPTGSGWIETTARYGVVTACASE